MTLHDALEVHVELGGSTVLAGRAQFHRSRGRLSSTTFQYDPSYLERPSSYALDPALPLVSGTQQTSGLPGAFADSAPDRWGRDLVKKRERALAREETRRTRDFDDADFLASVSDATRQRSASGQIRRARSWTRRRTSRGSSVCPSSSAQPTLPPRTEATTTSKP
jgi:serine/threonine-protein kinase HipA